MRSLSGRWRSPTFPAYFLELLGDRILADRWGDEPMNLLRREIGVDEKDVENLYDAVIQPYFLLQRHRSAARLANVFLAIEMIFLSGHTWVNRPESSAGHRTL